MVMKWLKHGSQLGRVVFALCCIFVAARGQEPSVSAGELVSRLVHTSDELRGTVSCGVANADRQLAVLIAQQGALARTSLETALQSVADFGEKSEFAPQAGLFMLADTKITGAPGAYLTKILANPRLEFLQGPIDQSLALSRGLTSYVSASRRWHRIFQCVRREEPRDALDQFILAWVHDNRTLLIDDLDADGRAAFNKLERTKSWNAMRNEFWRGKVASNAVGYKFLIAGQWSKPPEMLEKEVAYSDFEDSELRPKIVADFFNAGGTPCGRVEVGFARTKVGSARFLLNGANLEELLRVISACAAQTN